MKRKVTAPQPTQLELAPSKDPFARRALAATLAGALTVGVTVQHYVSGQDATINRLQQINNRLLAENNTQQSELTRLGRIMAGLNGTDPSQILRTDLIQPEQLPAYGQQVATPDKLRLEDSAVKIVSRPRGTAQQWTEACSGNKTIIGGTTYVTWAAHCDREAWNTATTSTRPVSTNGGATDVLPYSAYDFAIAEPDDYAGSGAQALLALVTGDAMMPDRTDQALLSIDTSNDVVLDDSGRVAFNKLASLDASDFAYVSPALGQSVDTLGYSSASHDLPIEGTGMYLGRIVAPQNDSTSSILDVVGIRNVSLQTDSCNHGESGSAAVFANGQTSGSLSERLGNVYAAGSGDGYESAVLNLQQQLGNGIDITSFDTFCYYTAPSLNDISALVPPCHDVRRLLIIAA